MDGNGKARWVLAFGLTCSIGCGDSSGPPGGIPVQPNANNVGGAGASGASGTTAGTGGTGGTGVSNGGMAGRAGSGTSGGGSGKGGGGGAAGSMMAASGSGGTGMTMPPPTTGDEPKIPMAPEPCPTLATGNVTILGTTVQLWVGQKQEGKKGAIFLYWHGTGGRSTEAVGGLGAALQEITSEGGVVASMNDTTMDGRTTGNNVWYTGDFAIADQVVACAVQQLNIDTRRIYTGGCSAGGLQASAMVYERSSYLAGAMPNSGGTVFPYQLQDPAHVPALITTHGMMGVDVVGIDFATTSARQTADIAAKGGYVVNCDHGGRHCGSPSAVKAAQWQFLKDHPFGVATDPYANGLPASFPDVCKVIK